ncbi:MAG: hypothetical protein EOO99_00375 [Pedobacter sp.]|nr:MAG: hypothetical protein EOO99_00375 [Pedobacter sp.]
MTLSEDFEAFINLLNQYEVEYLVVGGYALAFHGHPRFTGDLDIWINTSVKNANKMVQVLTDFGFGSIGFTPDDFLEENTISQIGYPPLRIDILNSIDGVNFHEAFKHKVEIEIEDLKIKYIALGDLIKNKKAAGRTQDLLDVKILTSKFKKNGG